MQGQILGRQSVNVLGLKWGQIWGKLLWPAVLLFVFAQIVHMTYVFVLTLLRPKLWPIGVFCISTQGAPNLLDVSQRTMFSRRELFPFRQYLSRPSQPGLVCPTRNCFPLFFSLQQNSDSNFRAASAKVFTV